MLKNIHNSTTVCCTVILFILSNDLVLCANFGCTYKSSNQLNVDSFGM